MFDAQNQLEANDLAQFNISRQNQHLITCCNAKDNCIFCSFVCSVPGPQFLFQQFYLFISKFPVEMGSISVEPWENCLGPQILFSTTSLCASRTNMCLQNLTSAYLQIFFHLNLRYTKILWDIRFPPSSLDASGYSPFFYDGNEAWVLLLKQNRLYLRL